MLPAKVKGGNLQMINAFPIPNQIPAPVPYVKFHHYPFSKVRLDILVYLPSFLLFISVSLPGYRSSLIRTASARCGNAVRNAGPRLQLFRLRRWLSNTGLISHCSSSLHNTPGVLTAGSGVGGAGGELVCAAVL